MWKRDGWCGNSVDDAAAIDDDGGGGGGDSDIITFSPQDLAGRPGPVWDHVIVCDKVAFS